MTIKRFSRAVGIAAGLTIMTLSPALAVAQEQSGAAAQQGEQPKAERVMPGRIGGDRNERRQQRERQQAAAPADPAVIKAEVEAIFTAASTSCQVTEAKLLGLSADEAKVNVYEAACAGAEGVIVRLNAERVVQQVYPCATAQQIGGGCKLTTTAPASTPQT